MDIIKDFNVILHDTEWIHDKNVDLSDFAVDEAYMMHMIRILEAHSFKSILDLGCGQTTLILSQYAETHQADLLTIESDPKWADKLQMEHPIVNVKKHIQYYRTVTNEASMYVGLTRDLLLQKNKYDFISVDGPYGFNCEHMSRINILELISNGLMADKFVIMLHDINRTAEMNTAKACTSLLDALGIRYHKTISWFGKGTFIISNIEGFCND
jgi:predicted RNA methylase